MESKASTAASVNRSIVVRPIGYEQTYPLRSQVLRPGLPLETCQFTGDQDASTQHWGAFLSASQGAPSDCAGVASVYQSPCLAESVSPQWKSRLANSDNDKIFQLRGMATSPAVRGYGCGRALLQALSEQLLNHPQALLWANARSEAIGFYEHCGYRVVSDEFMIEGVGPHYVIVQQPLEAC